MNVFEEIPDDVEVIGEALENAENEKNTGLINKTLETAKKLLSKYTNNKFIEIKLYYDIAIGNSKLAILKTDDTNEYTEKTILFYRKALRIYDNFRKYTIKSDSKKINFLEYVAMKCYTNLGIQFMNLSRYISAIDNFHNALLINDCFAMASLNLSLCLLYYGHFQARIYEKQYFYHAAYYYFKKTETNRLNLENQAFLEDLKNKFSIFTDDFIHDFLEKPLNLPELKFNGKKEIKYRQYISIFRLFLEPCCEILSPASCFMQDSLVFFDIKLQKDFFGLLNQIKSEFSYARNLWYETTVLKEPKEHLADRELFLVDLNDTAQHSYRDFLLRTAFKTLYSLFDKIALFINYYFDIGIVGNEISFKNIWKNKDLRINKLNPYEKISKLFDDNILLKAMYWIQKDLIEDDETNITEPTSIKMCKLRNDMEHNALQTIINLPQNKEILFTEYVSEYDIEESTFTLLKLARETIIYLVFSVYQKKYGGKGD